MNVREDLDTTVLDETWLDDTACCRHDDNPATWLAGCRKCPSRVEWCERHCQSKMRAAERSVFMWGCRNCGNESVDWHEAFFAVPL